MMENKNLITKNENSTLNIIFPEKPLEDYYTKELDTAKHPICILYDAYGIDRSYAFRITSNRFDDSSLYDLLFITTHKNTDINYTRNDKIKKDSYINCTTIYMFDHYWDYKGNNENDEINNDTKKEDEFDKVKFYSAGNILENRYEEIMSEALAKFIFLQDHGLAHKNENDDNIEYLFLLLNLTKDDIINSKEYQKCYEILKVIPEEIIIDRKNRIKQEELKRNKSL